MSRKPEKSYASIWNQYVESGFDNVKKGLPSRNKNLNEWQVLNTDDAYFEWPGDEWGSNKQTKAILKSTLFKYLSKEATVIIEIGAGAGRYTQFLFENYPRAKVLAVDISDQFIDALKRRFPGRIKDGRLETIVLTDDPQQIRDFAARTGILGKVDAVISYDSMVHVDLHTLTIFWITAARVLNQDGILSMSVADATNERGFMKLLYDAPGVFKLQGGVGGHFYWLSLDLLQTVLERLGFELLQFTHANRRDVYFIAKLVDRERHSMWINRAGAAW